MPMGKRPSVGGEERDAFSRKAKNYFNWKPGERKAIKARANRRDRRKEGTYDAND
jgi:hypothetical protein